VPWFKSVFFLKASLAVEGINGSVTFGVLGYCFQLNNGTTCSKASVGYQLGKTPFLHHAVPLTVNRPTHRYRQACGKQN
jgi:hypothetical protein